MAHSKQFNPEDYQFLRVYKCINHEGRKLMQMIFEWGLKLPPGETLKEHIQKKNNYSDRKYRNRYDEGQKKLIASYNVHKGELFDISVLYKLIQDTSYDIAPLHDQLWTTPNSTLEYLLQSAKTHRNEISHSLMTLDKAGALQKIEEYRNLFLNLVEEAGIRYKRDVVIEKTDIAKIIDEIKDFPLMENEITQLQRQQIHERSKKKMVIDGGLEMKQKYRGQSDLNPLTLTDGTNFRLPVTKVYQKLEIRDCGRNAKNIFIDSNDILRLNAECVTVTNLNDSVDLVILEGPTGSGKTTITKLLLAEWSTNPSSLIKGLFDYELLIYMECRNPNTESLKNLLQCLMPSTCNNIEENPEITLSDCSILIIIDSLDEINDKSEKLVNELLELIKMKNVTGICTMRPTKAQDVFSLLPSELKRVHLQSRGIPDDQRGHFVKMYHEELRTQGKSDQSTQELMQHLSKTTSRLQEHLRYPINLVHLVYLWAIAPKKVKFVTTATELYSSIYEVVQIKLSERLIFNSLTNRLTHEERMKQTLKFLEALYIESMNNLTHQHFCILPEHSEAVLKKVCSDNSLDYREMFSAFLVTKTLWTGFTSKTEYSISHTDMQEYLAACCIFNAVTNLNYRNMLRRRINGGNQNGTFNIDTLTRKLSLVNTNPVTDVLKIFFPNSEIPLKDYRNVLKHLSGLFVLNDESMSKYVAKDIVKLLKKSGMNQPEDWLDIYAETKSDKFMVKYLSNLCGDMLSGDIIIRDSRLAAYAKLLCPESSHSCHGDVPDSPSVVSANSLIINLKNPPTELPDLQELIRCVINLTCSIEVHLYFNWRNPKPGLHTAISNETHMSCKLKVVRGSPSSNELHLMHSTLEKLYISISDDNHARDVSSMLTSEKLPKLRAIYIHLKCRDVFSGALQPLNFCNSTNIVLFLSDVDDSNVSWAVDVACALQLQNGMYHCLYLPHNQLTSSGFLNLIHSLHQSNVKILVRIGITSDITDEKLDEALNASTAAARNQLQCDLLWYFSAERMEGW
ncbi:unnamed protein product [Meganyctiphanes norvegica]|uniref:NACHT domain-containing protein n=1 Tax=Meganyctiphanes norvegica TaxID=48144 RepID=A0AAV2R5W8_MEGNR